jgi:hypothetical protein
MPLITKIRIAALLVASWLFIGGCRSATHPALIVVRPKASQREQLPPYAFRYVELRTSRLSRVGGIVEMLLGGGVAFYALWPMWWRVVGR